MDDIKKLKNDAYREGYGQARADALLMLKEQRDVYLSALKRAQLYGAASEQEILELKMRNESLGHLQALIKSLKSKR